MDILEMDGTVLDAIRRIANDRINGDRTTLCKLDEILRRYKAAQNAAFRLNELIQS